MEGGSGSSSRAYHNSAMGLGDDNNNVNSELSSIVMMNSSAGITTGKAFLPTLGAANGSYDASNRNAGCFIDCGDTCNNMKANIMAHPHFPRLLAAYVNCQKVGAPPEVLARLEEVCASGEAMNRSVGSGCVGEDPALDQFVEAYCEMLTKYEQELTKPFKEAMLFLSEVETQLKTLTVCSSNISGKSGSAVEEIDMNDGYIDPLAEDGELKGQLLRKYSGCLGSLKKEFLKKKKKGKLPKEARQQLLDWWCKHNKWPYPSEPQKLALAESTGLDSKQINNWFINQRKRHWRPSDDMQFVVMDGAYPQYYMENVMGNSFSMDCTIPAPAPAPAPARF